MSDYDRSGEEIARHFQNEIAAIIQRRPALQPIVEPFGQVLLERSLIVAELKNNPPDMNLGAGGERLAAGRPVAAADDLLVLTPALETAAARLLLVMTLVFEPLRTDFNALARAVAAKRCDLGSLAKAYLEEDEACLEAAAQQVETSAAALKFAVYWALSAVLHAVRENWRPPAELSSWSAAHCPFCGSTPAISSLSQSLGGEDGFADSGGRRYLHCNLCGHAWRFERSRCPVCKTQDKDSLVYYQEPEGNGERIYTCRECGSYLLSIDFRQCEIPYIMDLAALGMTHLDIWAQNKGYRPVTWLPWNCTGDVDPLACGTAPADAIKID